MTKQTARDPAKILAAHELLRRLTEMKLPAVIKTEADVGVLRAYAAAKLVVVDFTDPGLGTIALVHAVTPDGLQAVASLPRAKISRTGEKPWLG